jgi:hypothetical protein
MGCNVEAHAVVFVRMVATGPSNWYVQGIGAGTRQNNAERRMTPAIEVINLDL